MATKKKGTKKRAKKKTASKKATHTKEKTIIREKLVHPKSSGTEKILVENFVSLQKVMTNLSLKFDDLTKKLSKLLELFEISAKVLAEKDVGEEKANKDTKEILSQMNNLVDQNRTIAKGLTLMHDKLENPEEYHPPYEVPKRTLPPSMPPRAPPRMMPPQKPHVPKQVMEKTPDENGYRKSISSNQKEFP